jgi:glycosyltransferase involved in cell wall biosynthesis
VTAANSITITVPARNEESRLEDAVRIVIDAIEERFDEYEVLVFNDGSTDRTGQVANRLADRYEHVVAIHNPRSLCLGGVIQKGLNRARMTYSMYVDGKGATTREALDRIFAHIGEADLVIPYPTNGHERPLVRRIVSWAFHSLLNVLFGLKLHYYNHLVVCRADLARRVRVRTRSYASQAELIIKLLKSGYSCVEVGVEDIFDIKGRRTRAFKLGNMLGVAIFFVRTVWDVHVRRERYDR